MHHVKTPAIKWTSKFRDRSDWGPRAVVLHCFTFISDMQGMKSAVFKNTLCALLLPNHEPCTSIITTAAWTPTHYKTYTAVKMQIWAIQLKLSLSSPITRFLWLFVSTLSCIIMETEGCVSVFLSSFRTLS